MRLFILFLLLSRSLSGWAVSLPAFDYKPLLASIQLPDNFTIELVAGEEMIRFPMFASFDDQGRLYVTESSGKDLYDGLKRLTRDCRVSRLEDTNGDGIFDKTTIFQDNVTFPMGLAWHDGRLYLADPPELVALTDTDGDGRADKREVILTGFGHTDNGSLHGLKFGPDGLLYFTMGQPDGWKLPRPGGGFWEGEAGALFRSRPDGSNVDVICRGFENLVEVEFLPGGEIIADDNWYQRPAGGYRDALIDCTPGGLYPIARDRGTSLLRSGILLPPVILLPAVAHSGLVRVEGAGLPPEMRSNLFVAEHNTRKVVRHQLTPFGSTFTSTNLDFAVGTHPDFHPSDVLEDADGSLLIIDTGGWYVEHCPTGRIRDSHAPGGIYRIRWTAAKPVADPRGLKLDWKKANSASLAERLNDPRHAVADLAVEELVRRDSSSPFLNYLEKSDNPGGRLKALWALSRFSDEASLAVIRSTLQSADPILTCLAARVLAFRHDHGSASAFAALLKSANASVRRAAAEALQECGSLREAPAVAKALESVADAFEEHTCIAALARLADEPFVRALLQTSTPRVLRAALHLLDRPPFATLQFADLVPALSSEDHLTREVAARLLEGHEAWAANASPWLREQLTRTNFDAMEQGSMASVVIALQKSSAVRNVITEILERAQSLPSRARLLDLLPSLNKQPPDGAWLRSAASSLTNNLLRRSALRVALAYSPTDWGPSLERIADDSGVPATERFLAARARSIQPTLTSNLFSVALHALRPGAEPEERLLSVDLLTRASLQSGQAADLIRVLQPGAAVAPDPFIPALLRSLSGAPRLYSDFLRSHLSAGWSPNEATFDKCLAPFPKASATARELRTLWEKNNGTRLERLAVFRPLLKGGDPDLGREWFTRATCTGCHKIGSLGGMVGPDLTKVGAIRSGNDLLESILFPSSSFAQGYESWLLIKKNGDEISGTLLSRQSEVVTFRDGAGQTHHLPTREIESIKPQQLSIMPEGLEQLMTRDQFRDLLAYLQSLR